MNGPLPLDVLSLPLDGLIALEASAGTGKTFTITKLYLRLLLEAGLPVERILVVTFTVAATQELRHRIRAQLEAAERWLSGGRLAEPDPVLEALLERQPDRALAARRVRHALVGLDQAAVFTIHGFCQRVLAEQAFESGQPFTAELIPDGGALLQEVVDDAWRAETHGGEPHVSPLWVDWLRARLRGPDEVAKEIGRHVGRQDVHVEAPDEPGDVDALEATCVAAWKRLRGFTEAEILEAAAAMHPAVLNQQSYKPEQVATRLAVLRALRARPEAPLDPDHVGILRYFAAEQLQRKTKKNQVPPAHDLFACCETLSTQLRALAEAYARRGAAWQHRLLRDAPAQLDARKQRRQVQTFDDLLVRLARALAHPMDGATLAAAVRARFGAALVDEFQDTDPLQYAIVRSVWGAPGAPLVLVGDPKQAIYSFRGADVYAYLGARREASRVEHLLANHRSDPLLVAAVSALFENVPRAFLLDDIPFLAAAPADADRPPGLRIAGEDTAAPLRFWTVPRGAAKADAKDRIAAAVAGEIARLVTAGTRGEAVVRRKRVGHEGPRWVDEPLGGGDVAVLVRTNDEARLMRDALLAVGVPSVLQTQDSVLGTSEAADLRLVLLALAEPGREDLVRAALATEMLGVTGDELERLAADESAWTARLDRFRALHDTWREHGAARVLRQLLAQEAVPARLLAYADGERRLTNVLHCCELLAAAAASERLGPEALIAWMTARRDEKPADGDESLLRLESDEHLVRVVTIHKSKGLQYPIAFCPFLWDGWLHTLRRASAAPQPDEWRATKPSSLLYHDPEHGNRLTLDLRPAPDPRLCEYARREELAERLRLLYVALTRAQHRCVVVWGVLPDAGTSALRWLLHPPDRPAATTAELRDGFRDTDDATVVSALGKLARSAPPGAIAVQPLPAASSVRAVLAPAATEALAARPFPGPVPSGWRIASFTSLTARRDAEAPDHDALAALPAAPPGRDVVPGTSILDFPSGARAGSCIHEIFEHHDFTSGDRPALETLAGTRLAAHGLDPVWGPVLADTVERVLSTHLGPDGRIRLATVPAARRLAELEFTYPLARLDTVALRALVRRHGLAGGAFAATVERLELNPAHGYMRGFIDLVFEADGRWWLVDWKSNRLGPARDDYRRPALDAAMARHAYWLQYLVYTVAVHRHLQLRLPAYDYETHFGGVLYLFVRGIDPRPGDGCGVFFDRPPAALVAALDAHLRGAG